MEHIVWDCPQRSDKPTSSQSFVTAVGSSKVDTGNRGHKFILFHDSNLPCSLQVHEVRLVRVDYLDAVFVSVITMELFGGSLEHG